MTNPRANTPTILVVLGATGDLMSRKITPALFHLFEKEELPEKFEIAGFSRSKLDDGAFREYVADVLEGRDDISVGRRLTKPFLDTFSYVSGDLTDLSAYKSIGEHLQKIDAGWGLCSNKLFYLAVPPPLYGVVFKNLAKSGLTEPCGGAYGWTRIIVEKPFGKDLKTAEELDTMLGMLFKEEQIYRIDHYLGKEMIRNIMAFRFANAMFEPSWSAKYVEKIELKLLETLSVEGRGEFYDGVGALRDVGQNHLLQMLAMLTMEHPDAFEDGSVRRRREEILRSLRLPRGGMKHHAFRAQYRGYREAEGTLEDSKTETYFKIRAELDCGRWRGVPIIFEGGKAMAKTEKELVVKFKHPKPCMCGDGMHIENSVVFSLEPEEIIRIRFAAKKPGLSMAMEERSFDFYYRKGASSGSGTESYEKLLLDCILGDQLLFVSTGEVSAMWRFIDPIVNAWQKDEVPLLEYDVGSQKVLVDAEAAIQM